MEPGQAWGTLVRTAVCHGVLQDDGNIAESRYVASAVQLPSPFGPNDKSVPQIKSLDYSQDSGTIVVGTNHCDVLEILPCTNPDAPHKIVSKGEVAGGAPCVSGGGGAPGSFSLWSHPPPLTLTRPAALCLPTPSPPPASPDLLTPTLTLCSTPPPWHGFNRTLPMLHFPHVQPGLPALLLT